MIAASCPPDDVLTDYLRGELPRERFRVTGGHLEQCESCQGRLSSVEHAAGVGIAGSMDVDGLAEPELADAMLRCVRRIEPRPAVDDTVTPPVTRVGPYRLLRRLGRGGMASVYLARHEHLDRLCAVKLLPLGGRTDAVNRFRREMKSLAAVDHPNVVAATDAGEDPPWHYLVMRYVDGVDLSQVIDAVGTVDVATACAIGARVAAALSALHDAGLVHRDIKPSNIMLTRDGQVQLLDFGLAGDAADRLGDASRLTTVGQVVGTVLYASPEQLAGETLDARSDLYSLGVTLYRLITGRHPHGTTADASLVEVLHAKTTRDAEPPVAQEGKVPFELADLLIRSLHHDRDGRPGGAPSVAETLTRHADDRSVKALVKRVSNLVGADAPPMLPTIALESAGGRGGGWTAAKWLAGAGGLVALVFSVLLTLKTNNGTLVVRSEGDGEVHIEPIDGNGPVRELRVRSGDNRTVVTAGRYRVTAPADTEIDFIPAEVVVEGGGEALVDSIPNADLSDEADGGSIRSLAEQTGLTPEDLRRTSAGMSVAEHLRRVRFDMDVQTIADSTRAVLPLVTAERDALAKWLLKPTGQLGGWDDSGYVTSVILDGESSVRLGSRLLTQNGWDVFTNLLVEGNGRSRAAALRFLDDRFSHGGSPPVGEERSRLAEALNQIQKVHGPARRQKIPGAGVSSQNRDAARNLIFDLFPEFDGLVEHFDFLPEYLHRSLSPFVNSETVKIHNPLRLALGNVEIVARSGDNVLPVAIEQSRQLLEEVDAILKDRRWSFREDHVDATILLDGAGWVNLPPVLTMHRFLAVRRPSMRRRRAFDQLIRRMNTGPGVVDHHMADAFVAAVLMHSHSTLIDLREGSQSPNDVRSDGSKTEPESDRWTEIDDWVRPGVMPPWFDSLDEVARQTRFPGTLRYLLELQTDRLALLPPEFIFERGVLDHWQRRIARDRRPGAAERRASLRRPFRGPRNLEGDPMHEAPMVTAGEMRDRLRSVIDEVLNRRPVVGPEVTSGPVDPAKEAEVASPFEGTGEAEKPGGMF